MACSDPMRSPPPELNYPYIGPWTDGEEASFTVWAPRCQALSIERIAEYGTEQVSMERDEYGVFRTEPVLLESDAAAIYWLVNEHGAKIPDPVSRFQPEGVWGPSQLVPQSFPWQATGWKGRPLGDYVIYELHVGTFTRIGTFDAAIDKLPYLQDLGVTCVELMPVGQFAGRWNWGYDGVLPYAAQCTYGGPLGLKRFIDACHAHGLAVCLDVVYNHLGPEGSVHQRLAPYTAVSKTTPWGDGLNFEGPHARFVRGYFLYNALQWLGEFRIDALRLDAVHSYHDHSERHLLRDLSDAVSALRDQTGRAIHLIAEGNVHNPHFFHGNGDRAWGLDANWNDDFVFSHFATFAGETRNQHRTYRPWQDLAEALQHGAVYMGLPWNARRVSDPASAAIDWSSQVFYVQNHDQVGNRPQGDRISTLYDAETCRMLMALVLLSPSIPLLFMGEEYGERNPFYFFVDFQSPELLQAVEHGRRREFEEHMRSTRPPAPHDPMCFEASKLSWAVSENDDTFAFYRRLIALRRTWRRHGLLTVQGRSLNLDPEQETIRIRYEANSHQAWVASSRDPGALGIPESGMGRIHYRTQGSTPHRYLWIADTCSITT